VADFKRELLAFNSLSRKLLAYRLAKVMIVFKLVVPDPEVLKKSTSAFRSLASGPISNARVNRARQGGFGWDKADLSPRGAY